MPRLQMVLVLLVSALAGCAVVEEATPPLPTPEPTPPPTATPAPVEPNTTTDPAGNGSFQAPTPTLFPIPTPLIPTLPNLTPTPTPTPVPTATPTIPTLPPTPTPTTVTPTVTPPTPVTPTPPVNTTPPAPQWPFNDSYATYVIEGTSERRPGEIRNFTTNVTWTFFNGMWTMECDGAYTTTPRPDAREPRWLNGSYERRVDKIDEHDTNPLAPNERAGRSVDAWYVRDCELDDLRVTIQDAGQNVTLDDVNEPVAAKHGTGGLSRGNATREATWHPQTGLVLTWDTRDRFGHVHARLVETDAPLATN